MRATTGNLHRRWLNARTAYQKWHPHIEFKRKTLALNQSELTQMVAMVGCVHDIRVVQFAQIFQFLQMNRLEIIKKKVNDICYYVSTFTLSHLASNVSHMYNTIIRDGTCYAPT